MKKQRFNLTDEQFNQLNSKLDALNANLARTHAEEFQWANAIIGRQQAFESRLGLDTTPRPFIPFYNPNIDPIIFYPEVFNKYGERMEIFFISDREIVYQANDRNSRYIIWDRYNYMNETHFYTQNEIFRTVGNPKRRFAMLTEAGTSRPQLYEAILKYKKHIEKHFDLVFTYNPILLNELSNARFVALAAVVYYGTGMNYYVKDNDFKFIISPENYKHKTKNISMLCSHLENLPMHIVRKKLAFYCKEHGLADTYGKFDGSPPVDMEIPFEKYRYSIVVENGIEPFYFTEKIMNAFAAQTIPIYLGATEIGRFFNADGIIQIDLEDCNHIENILKQCTPEEYERRLPAVIDNFNRAMRSMAQTRFDDLYVQYIRGK